MWAQRERDCRQVRRISWEVGHGAGKSTRLPEPRGKCPAPGPLGGTPLAPASTRPSGRDNGQGKQTPAIRTGSDLTMVRTVMGLTRASGSTGAGVGGRGAPAAPDLPPPCQEPLPLRLLPRWRPRATSPTGNGAGQRAEGGAPWGGDVQYPAAGQVLPRRYRRLTLRLRKLPFLCFPRLSARSLD